jgi:hypothetical protein
MDWLKALLEKAEITDGKLDTGSLMKEVNKEFPQHAVPKTDFNALVETRKALEGQLAEANKQIESFKGMDVEGIRKAAEDWKVRFEEADRAHKAEMEKTAYQAAAERFIDAMRPKDGLSKSAALAEFVRKGLKLEGDKFVGGQEWAGQFKKDNAAHFAEGEGGVTTASSGGSHGGALDGDADKFTAAAMKGAGIAPGKTTEKENGFYGKQH